MYKYTGIMVIIILGYMYTLNAEQSENNKLYKCIHYFNMPFPYRLGK